MALIGGRADDGGSGCAHADLAGIPNCAGVSIRARRSVGRQRVGRASGRGAVAELGDVAGARGGPTDRSSVARCVGDAARHGAGVDGARI